MHLITWFNEVYFLVSRELTNKKKSLTFVNTRENITIFTAEKNVINKLESIAINKSDSNTNLEKGETTTYGYFCQQYNCRVATHMFPK